MPYLAAAEWGAWGPWGACSATCDYGVRQKVRPCSVVDACSGIGLDTATEYCSPGNCATSSAPGEELCNCN